MKDRPAMTSEEVEELIQDLSTNVGISEALADDMLDAGYLISWAAHENDFEEAAAHRELERTLDDLKEFINEELSEGRDMSTIVIALWYQMQEMDERIRQEAPKEEVDDEVEPRDVMFQ
jgi:CO dehydrogenase/acetyl-CoA synthase alpha subunit